MIQPSLLNSPNINVVIVGQDPYPQPGIATGIAFGVEQGKPLPPSLNIIQTELALTYYNDITYYIEDTTLESWVKQGVLLLNASLTCEAYKPESEEYLFTEGSHSWYWRLLLMEQLFKWMNEHSTDVVFVFMGNKAKYYSRFIDPVKNHIINVVHPVADYRSGVHKFIGSGVFNKINEFLNGKEKTTIAW